MTTATGAEPRACDRIRIELGGQTLELLPSRCVWWGATRTLVASDLHLGKSQTLRAAGAPMVAGVTRDTLERLDAALRATGAERLLILGDVIHASVGITPDIDRSVRAWRAGWAGRLEIVPGNHDRGIEPHAEAWGATLLDGAHAEGGLVFRHEPGVDGRGPVVAGHLHPAVTLRARGDSVKLPCFVARTRALVLPAFSAFTAGGSIPREPGDRRFGVLDGTLIEVP